METEERKPKYKDKKSIWVYMLYIGVTPCMLAAVGLMIYLAVKGVRGKMEERKHEVVETVEGITEDEGGGRYQVRLKSDSSPTEDAWEREEMKVGENDEGRTREKVR